MTRSISSLPAFVAMKSADGANRAVALGLALDDEGLKLVLHDFESNVIKVVDAALWHVDRSPSMQSVLIPGQAAHR